MAQLLPLEKAFLEEAFAFVVKRGYYVLHEIPLLPEDFSFSSKRHGLG